MLIDSYHKSSIATHELPTDLQPSLHERQPFRVPIVVITGDVIVVVLPVPRPSVVRRVDVDGVDGMPVRVGQHLQRVVVLSVDDRVERLVATPLNPACLHQAGVDAIPELCDNHHVVSEYNLHLGLLSVQLRQVRHPLPIDTRDPCDAPQPLVFGLCLPSGRQHTHLVAATYGSAGQLDGLRLMLLEDEPEGATLGQRSDLGFQVGTKLRVRLARLPQQFRQSRHG